MKILIAGATGAVGLSLVRVLCAAGHEVTDITRQGPLQSRRTSKRAARVQASISALASLSFV